MKNFCGCAKNHENRESFLSRKFHGIRYVILLLCQVKICVRLYINIVCSVKI